MIPDACDSAAIDELNLWQCFACRGTQANDWAFKAEATSTYAKLIDSIMKKQNAFSGIKRSFVDDIRGKKFDVDRNEFEIGEETVRYPYGYIKVCASWMMRLWSEEKAQLTDLNEQTNMFDQCGVYNGKS